MSEKLETNGLLAAIYDAWVVLDDIRVEAAPETAAQISKVQDKLRAVTRKVLVTRKQLRARGEKA